MIEADYLARFKEDPKQVIGEEFDILDELFADVDDYVSDPTLKHWRHQRRRVEDPRARRRRSPLPRLRVTGQGEKGTTVADAREERTGRRDAT